MEECTICDLEGSLKECRMCEKKICSSCRVICSECKSIICENCAEDGRPCPICHGGSLYMSHRKPRKKGPNFKSDQKCRTCGNILKYIEGNGSLKLFCPKCNSTYENFVSDDADFSDNPDERDDWDYD